MGPLELADFIGLDPCLSIMQVLHEGLADSKYRPCPILVEYAEAVWLDRQTQRGFHDYCGDKPSGAIATGRSSARARTRNTNLQPVQDENKQLQIATTVLRSTANAEKIAAQTRLAGQAPPADPGPGLGGNLDVTV